MRITYFFLFIALISSCQNKEIYKQNLSTPKADEDDTQLRRFKSALETLRNFTDTTSASVAAKNLTEKKSAREAAFRLQGLGRIYREEDQMFDEMSDIFKDLEDLIGVYAFQEEEDSAEGMEEARKDIEKFLDKKVSIMGDKESWLKGRVIKTYEKLLSEYDWGSYDEDRVVVIEALRKQLKKIYDRDWDLEILEDSNDGVHEYRRQIRWFNIQVQALGGLVDFRRDNQCPASSYLTILLDQGLLKYKYSTIENLGAEISPCLISRCLFVGMGEAIKVYANIKGEAEHDREMREANRISGALLRKANQLKEKLDDAELMKTLRSELKSCIE